MEHQKIILENIGRVLKVKTKEDWYSKTGSDIRYAGGGGLLSCYQYSLTRMITTVFNDYNWDLSKFRIHVPKGYYENKDNQKVMLSKIGETLGITKIEDWYDKSKEEIRNAGGSKLLYHYQSSPSRMITSILSDYSWDSSKFQTLVPKGHYENKDNQKRTLSKIGEVLGITKMEDWYNKTGGDIKNAGGGGLLSYYHFSPYRMVTTIFNEFQWDLTKFNTLSPKGFYQSKEKQKVLLEKVGNLLKISEMEDWYHKTAVDIINAGGGGLLSYFRNSLPKMVTTIFSDYTWDYSKFRTHFPKGYYNNMENQKAILLKIGEILGIKRMEDWYKQTRNDIVKAGGGGLLFQYRSSVFKMITTIFSDFSWNLYKLQKHIPQLYWESKIKRKEFWESFQPQFNKNWSLARLSDIIKDKYGRSLIEHYNNNQDLQEEFPYNLIRQSIDQRKVTTPHQIIVDILNKYLKIGDMEVNHKLEDFYQSTGKQIELDILISKFQLAIEYNGPLHYNATLWNNLKSDRQNERDQEKFDVCKRLGIRLIVIPHWWNREESSLLTTIQEVCPEISKTTIKGELIPTSPSDVQFHSTEITQGRDYNGLDLKHWWMLEKYNGIRALWKGDIFISKRGRRMVFIHNSKSWFKEN